jgi:hypothetical protein
VSQGETVSKRCSPLRVMYGPHHRLVADDGEQAAADLELGQQAGGHFGHRAAEHDDVEGPSAGRCGRVGHRTSTFWTPARCRFSRAISASSGSISSVTTRWARWASRAAMKPEPVPISSTRSWLAP